MCENSEHNAGYSNEIQLLRNENAHLIKVIEEKSALIKGFEDQLLKQSKSFTILNSYSFELQNQSEEEIYSFIVNNFKSIFRVREVWISIYDEKCRELILKGTTLSDEENSKVVKMLGRNILGFRTPVTVETYNMMLRIGVGEPTSLHEISFGSIPLIVSSTIERLFGIGWFQGLTLTDRERLYGGLVVAGYNDQQPLIKEELKIFSEITSNILRRKQVEKELLLWEAKDMLSLERNMLRSLIDNLPDRIYAKDTSSRFIICNDALVKRMGKDRSDEIIGKSDLELMDRNRALGYIADEQNIIKTGIPLINKEETLIFKSGQIRWSLSTKVPLRNSHGEIVGIVGIGRDITDRKIAEMEVETKNELLQKIIVEKDKFFSIIAHDLKSPFNYFLGFTELISEEIDSMSPQRIREITFNMRKSAMNLYSLLENLLEWSKMQRGVLEFNPEKIVLHDRLVYCVDMISGPAAKKEISIDFKIPDNIEVFADKHMLDAIIRNLVSNSIKFTKRNGTITVSGLESADGIVTVSVCDIGIGMDEEMIKNLFKLDVDTRRNGTDNEPSTGLGLLLCKEFVEKHGGEIWVKSNEGTGSTFTFSLDNNRLLKSNIVVE